ncbi:dihydrodipicolinate reductase [Curvibacter sp. CHRR-16]|uniref:4-hydroxy-tetrahydrodipicolinate reductase n=1 Tax=Curvibacter sp. CHRR-16 TaxID=2835872 RepID=UPI001BDB6104|nr:dihydrodipicolinate reductase C-terminal domain-containing protein [Curvibacter sp. CHRR-16]MBT0570783.1 dihydrodipicolinate reductase [Curvibacter sp. CHRR-16]
MRIGLIGLGKAGQAVADVLAQDPQCDLRWIATRTGQPSAIALHGQEYPVFALSAESLEQRWNEQPVDALVDFSAASSAAVYSPLAAKYGITVVSAISAYSAEQLQAMRDLGQHTRIMCSPNITVGINFLIMAAKLLREIAPFADVEILEQHFKEKPEVSGTAQKIATSLQVGQEKITSMRLGGIVGHHEVIFGFPYQTVRLVHDSIKRQAFGTGTAFALQELAHYPHGFYTFEDLLLERMRQQILRSGNS